MSSSSKSSGSEVPAAVDEKKRKRMESNRESARRSRQRKKRHLDNLIRQAAQLQNQNAEISGKMAEISRRIGAVDATNAVLRAVKERLGRRLESLESVLEISSSINHGVTAGSFLESSNGPSSFEFGVSGLSDVASSEFGMVKPWRQTMTMTPQPGSSVSTAIMATSSGGTFQF